MDIAKNRAVVAGLSLALALGAAALPVAALAESASGDAEQAVDRAEVHQDEDQGIIASLMSLFGGRARLSAVALSSEMKYFTAYESNQNYDQGFSWGDGYNAMGYYQFDRRWSLADFMQQAYDYNPQTYSMFREVLDRVDELKYGDIYANGGFTQIGQLANSAWHAAYAVNPTEFAALQDAYAYNNYYLPVQETLLDSYGVDLSDRADCVKGLAWSMGNLFGTYGVRDFFDWARADSGLSDSMTDRELVVALTDAVIDHIKEYAPSQPEYWDGWINRYEGEREVCLRYIAEDESQAGTQEPSGPSTPSTPDAPGNGETNGSGSDTDGGAAKPDAGGTGTGLDTGSGDQSGPSSGDSAGKDDAGSKDEGGSNAGSNGSGSGSDSDNGSGKDDTESKGDGEQGGSNGSDGGATEGGSGANGGSESGGDERPATKRTVTFLVKGEVFERVEVSDGEVVHAPSREPEYDGYTFLGWSTSADEYVAYDFSQGVSADLELTAFYVKNASAGTDSDTDGSNGADGSVDASESTGKGTADTDSAQGSETAAAAKATAAPKGLPKTGDDSPMASLAAAGIALIGGSMLALEARSRRSQAV